MKYIRTRDGIYEVVIENDEIEVCQVKGHGSIDYKDIVKQSDDIEKLFDTFVLKATRENGISEHQVFWNAKLLRISKIAYEECGIPAEMHGAIWIIGKRGEPILKPFAKMNKEGGWKLL